MQDLFDIAVKVSTPLALGGFLATVLFFTLRQTLKKDIFPQLTKSASAKVLLTIIDRLFVLALVAMVLGFAGYVVPKPATPPPATHENTSEAPENELFLELKPQEFASNFDLSSRYDGEPLVTVSWELTVVNVGKRPVTLLDMRFWQNVNGVKSYHTELIAKVERRDGTQPEYPISLDSGRSQVFDITVRVPLEASVASLAQEYRSICKEASFGAFQLFLAYQAKKDFLGNSAEPIGDPSDLNSREPCSRHGGRSLAEAGRTFLLVVELRTARQGWISTCT